MMKINLWKLFLKFLNRGALPEKVEEKEELTVSEKLARKAEEEWNRNIIEENFIINSDITKMFDQNGWGPWLRHSDGGRCKDGYVRPPDPDWCGQAVANHALKLEPPINKTLCRKVLVSTYRLSRKAKWLDCNVPYALIEDHSDLKRGDIVVVKTGANKEYGDHIVVAITGLGEDNTFQTIEGNAIGLLPSSKTGRGLIKQTRNLEKVARIYRLTNEHTIVQDN